MKTKPNNADLLAYLRENWKAVVKAVEGANKPAATPAARNKATKK